MNKSSTFAKGALAAAAGLVALGAAAAASAQPYDGSGYGGYDPCRREANGRGVTGALVGGAGGAVIGSQLAARGHRTDGSLLGGIVGALAGAAVGHNTAACTNGPPPPYAYREAPPPPPEPSAYYEPAPRAYDDADYGPPPPPRYAERETVWAYGPRGTRLRVVEERAGPDGCTVAESPVYMPDGGVDRRFVRVCPDSSGRYRVID